MSLLWLTWGEMVISDKLLLRFNVNVVCCSVCLILSCALVFNQQFQVALMVQVVCSFAQKTTSLTRTLGTSRISAAQSHADGWVFQWLCIRDGVSWLKPYFDFQLKWWGFHVSSLPQTLETTKTSDLITVSFNRNIIIWHLWFLWTVVVDYIVSNANKLENLP